MHHAISLIELSSIAKGIEVADAMVKSAGVQLLTAKSVCPGKYIVMVGGDVAAVNQALSVGEVLAGHLLVDQFCLSRLHESILPAIAGTTSVPNVESIGVVETFSVSACIAAADSAVKAAEVNLLRIHMAYGIGGKCYFVLSGEVSSVQNAVEIASQQAGAKGLLVYQTVIARPDQQLINQLL